MVCPYDKEEVCGTDGVTYANKCHLSRVTCTTGKFFCTTVKSHTLAVDFFYFEKGIVGTIHELQNAEGAGRGFALVICQVVQGRKE